MPTLLCGRRVEDLLAIIAATPFLSIHKVILKYCKVYGWVCMASCAVCLAVTHHWQTTMGGRKRYRVMGAAVAPNSMMRLYRFCFAPIMAEENIVHFSISVFFRVFLFYFLNRCN